MSWRSISSCLRYSFYNCLFTRERRGGRPLFQRAKLQKVLQLRGDARLFQMGLLGAGFSWGLRADQKPAAALLGSFTRRTWTWILVLQGCKRITCPLFPPGGGSPGKREGISSGHLWPKWQRARPCRATNEENVCLAGLWIKSNTWQQVPFGGRTVHWGWWLCLCKLPAGTKQCLSSPRPRLHT